MGQEVSSEVSKFCFEPVDSKFLRNVPFKDCFTSQHNGYNKEYLNNLPMDSDSEDSIIMDQSFSLTSDIFKTGKKEVFIDYYEVNEGHYKLLGWKKVTPTSIITEDGKEYTGMEKIYLQIDSVCILLTKYIKYYSELKEYKEALVLKYEKKLNTQSQNVKKQPRLSESLNKEYRDIEELFDERNEPEETIQKKDLIDKKQSSSGVIKMKIDRLKFNINLLQKAAAHYNGLFDSMLQLKINIQNMQFSNQVVDVIQAGTNLLKEYTESMNPVKVEDVVSELESMSDRISNVTAILIEPKNRVLGDLSPVELTKIDNQNESKETTHNKNKNVSKNNNHIKKEEELELLKDSVIV